MRTARLALGVGVALTGVVTFVTAGPATGSSGKVVGSCPGASSVAAWSVADLARATIVVPVDAGQVVSVGAEVRAGVGGLLLTGDDAPEDLGTQLAALTASAPLDSPPLVMTDEEGGAVQRLANRIGVVPSPRSLGATETPAEIESLAKGVGEKMRGLGIDVDLAPVLDVDGGAGPNDRDPDGSRSFSAVPAVAAADGVAFAKGLLSASVLPVLKHFPGLGGASGNTDLEPASTRPYLGGRTPGLVPFRAAIAAGLPAVMVANASVPGLTAEPASVSPEAIDGLLRRTLGFHGLVLTDSLSVPSLSENGYSLVAAAVAAVRAGADEILYNALPSAVGPDADAITAGLVAAVATHRLSRDRLVEAVLDAERARTEIGACRVSAG